MRNFMKKVFLSTIAILAIFTYTHVHASQTMVCQSVTSGVQFIWVGNSCPPGSMFVSF